MEDYKRGDLFETVKGNVQLDNGYIVESTDVLILIETTERAFGTVFWVEAIDFPDYGVFPIYKDDINFRRISDRP